MNIEQLLVLVVAIFALMIALSLIITHHHIKTIYHGIDYLSLGVLTHITGFLVYTGVFLESDWLRFFIGNPLFIIGTLFFHKGLVLFMDRKIKFTRMYIILSIMGIIGSILFFQDVSPVFRENTMTFIIVYMVLEIMISLLDSKKPLRKSVILPIVIFCSLFLILIVYRFSVINDAIFFELIPNNPLSYQLVINFIGAVIFILLGFAVLLIISIRAINDLKNERQQLEAISITDHLTGLPNRLGLEKYIKTVLKKHERFAVLFSDFDEFKKLNDKYGHTIGDGVIMAFSKELLKLSEDHMFTARYGGDEFITIVTRFDSEKNLKEAIESKIKKIGASIQVDGYVFDLTVSVGVAIYPKDGDNIFELIGKADTALGKIKIDGKNNIKFYQ